MQNLRILPLILSFLSCTSFAQEVNFGFHLNPCLTIPVLDHRSVHTGTGPRPFTWHINTGLNATLKLKYISVESGMNIVTKSVNFKEKTYKFSVRTGHNGGYDLRASSSARATSSSIEIPLQVNWLMQHHAADKIYDIYLVTGVSFEQNTFQGYSTRGSSSSDGANTFSANILELYPEHSGGKKDWFNVILGFKINAIIRKIGLIDYGIVYHMPVKDAGLHHVKTEVTTASATEVYNGDYYPYLSYLDIKLCYYFLNFEKGSGRKKYRKYE